MKLSCLWMLGLLLSASTSAPAAEPAKEPRYADRTLSQWIADLDDADPLVREEAAEVLARLGPQAKPAIARLEKIAAADAGPVRRRAALALWKIGGSIEPAKELFAANLEKSTGLQRLESIQVLRQLGKPAKELAPYLIDLVLDTDYSVSNPAIGLLQQFGDDGTSALIAALKKARGSQAHRLVGLVSQFALNSKSLVPILQKMLKIPDPRLQVACARVLWQWNQDRDGLTKLVVEWSQRKDFAVKNEAMQLAFSVQPKPKEFEPIFRAALKGSNNDFRYRSVQALWEMNPKSLKENLNILIDGIKGVGRNGSWFVAAQALSAIGPDAKQALPALLDALNDPNGMNYAYNLAPAIARMGPDAVEPLAKNLGSTNYQLQTASRQALQMIGPAAAPKLTPLLKNADSRVRIEVLAILGGYGAIGKEALPVLVDLIKGSDPPTRNRALNLLGQIGSDAAEATPDLVKLIAELDKPNTKANLQTLVRAIGKIGPPAQAAAPELKKLLTHAEPLVRADAAEALLRVQPASKSDAVPVLFALLREKKPGINVQLLPDLLLNNGVSAGELMALLRDYVKAQPGMKQLLVLQLSNRRDPIKEAAPLLRDLMKDANRAVRYQAAVALSRLGADGKDAIPELRTMLRQPSTSWRDRAAEALARLGPLAQDALPDLLDQWRTAVAVDAKLRLAEPILAIDADKGKPVLDWLRGQVENLNVTRRINALRILAQHDGKNPNVLKDLLTLARTQHVYYSGLAFDAIGLMGANAKSALPDLRAALKDENVTKRVRAAAAIWKIEGKADAVLPVLSAALRETDPITPGAYYSILPRTGAALAATTLSEMGPAAKSALPALRKASAMGDATLRQNATEAIARIEAK